jgi:hypothetical protein
VTERDQHELSIQLIKLLVPSQVRRWVDDGGEDTSECLLGDLV